MAMVVEYSICPAADAWVMCSSLASSSGPESGKGAGARATLRSEEIREGRWEQYNVLWV
jgi:hypothetical protein